MTDKSEWSTAGANIMAADQLAAVRQHLEEIGFVVVLWWHYFGSQAPTRLTFDSYEEFERFVKAEPRQGDAIDVWPFPEDPAARIAYGKIPNEKGETPEHGAY